jgi:hypothetical protein
MELARPQQCECTDEKHGLAVRKHRRKQAS